MNSELKATLDWWKEHVKALRATEAVGEQNLTLLQQYIIPDMFGDEIRVDRKMSQWDIFYHLEMRGVSKADRILLSGLTVEEVAHLEEREETLSTFGLDIDRPEDQEELAYIRGLDSISDADRELNITFMKAILAGKTDEAMKLFNQMSPAVQLLNAEYITAA